MINDNTFHHSNWVRFWYPLDVHLRNSSHHIVDLCLWYKRFYTQKKSLILVISGNLTAILPLHISSRCIVTILVPHSPSLPLVLVVHHFEAFGVPPLFQIATSLATRGTVHCDRNGHHAVSRREAGGLKKTVS